MSWSLSQQLLVAATLLAVGGASGWALRPAEGTESRPVGVLVSTRTPTPTEPAESSMPTPAAPSAAAPSTRAERSEEAANEDDTDSLEGESLAESLARLEQEYRLMLLRTERLELALLEDRQRALESSLAKMESNQALGDQPPAQPVPALQAAPSDHLASTQPVSNEAIGESDDDWENDDNYLYKDASLQDDAQVVIVNYAPVVYVAGGDHHRPHSGNHRTPQSKASSLSVQHQRAIRSPITTQSRLLGTPRSPWAPIDMSKHNNPWAGSRLP